MLLLPVSAIPETRSGPDLASPQCDGPRLYLTLSPLVRVCISSPCVPLYQVPSSLSCCGYFGGSHWSLVHWVAKPPPYALWFCTDTSRGAQGASLPVGVWAQEQGLALINCLDLHGPIPNGC